MINSIFYSITNQNEVFCFKIIILEPKNDLFKVTTSLIGDYDENSSIFFHHAEYLKSFYVIESILEKSLVFENEKDAVESAKHSILEKIDLKEKDIKALKTQMEKLSEKTY